MARINLVRQTVDLLILYAGPIGSGKSTVLRQLSRAPELSELEPTELSEAAGITQLSCRISQQIRRFGVRCYLKEFRVQTHQPTAVSLWLKGVDGLVFVVDSSPGALARNQCALEQLQQGEHSIGEALDRIPCVLLYNKRDLPGAEALMRLSKRLNPAGVPEFASNALIGQGLMPAFRSVTGRVLDEMRAYDAVQEPAPPSEEDEALSVSAPQSNPAAALLEKLVRSADLPQEPSDDDHEWPTVPGYRLVRLISRTLWTFAYEAIRDDDGCEVAVLVSAQDYLSYPGRQDYLVASLELWRRLDHPHVVALFDHGQAQGGYYAATELVRGQTLFHELQPRTTFPADEAVGIMSQVLGGLAHAHQLGIVHRALNSQDILLDKTSQPWTAKLASFQRACRTAQSTTRQGDPVWPPWDASIQVPDGQLRFDPLQATTTSDVWRAAAELYRMLTGESPMPWRSTVGPFVEYGDEIIPLRQRDATLDERLAAVVDRALARRPDDRYPDAGAFLAALQSTS